MRKHSNINRGGYLIPVPGELGELIHKNRGSEPSQIVLDALNRLQNTPYKVNQYILSVMEVLSKKTWEIGSYRSYEYMSYEDEHKPLFDSDYLNSLDPESDELKAAKRTLTEFYHNQMIDQKKADSPRRTLLLAQKYRDMVFYMPWFLDKRGRCYPVVEGLSPQGPDYQKALLLSGIDIPVNDQTEIDLLIWIATAGAFDKVDKEDFITRKNWAMSFVRSEECKAMLREPWTYRVWMKADEPFQFLAACKEWSDIFDTKSKDTCCLFVFRDATNSGLQILSGLSRDPKGAFHTNVLITDKPQDAYKLCSERAQQLMRDPAWMTAQFEKREKRRRKANKNRSDESQIEARGTLFEFDIDCLNRSHLKKALMTRLYNSAFLTRFQSILESLKKKDDIELHPGDRLIVAKACEDAISMEFETGLQLNRWFQDVAKAAMDKGLENLTWISPSGMKVVNEYREPLFKEIKSYAAGGGHYAELMRDNQGLSYLQTGFGDVKESKVMSSTSANFIHSLDSAQVHLACLDIPKDLPVFFVHDCVACVAGTSSEVLPHVRKAFHNVVTSEPLWGLLEENGLDETLVPPEKGDAPIDECLKSPYLWC